MFRCSDRSASAAVALSNNTFSTGVRPPSKCSQTQLPRQPSFVVTLSVNYASRPQAYYVYKPALQTSTLPSSPPETRFCPLLLKAMLFTGLEWSRNVCTNCPDSADQSLTVESNDAVAIRDPSGLTAIRSIAVVCPESSFKSWPLFVSNTIARPLAPPTTTCGLFGKKQIDVGRKPLPKMEDTCLRENQSERHTLESRHR